MKKRMCSVLLCVCLLIGLLPASVLAEGETGNVAKVGSTEYATIDEALANWGNNTTLTLLADVTLSDVVRINSTEHHYLDLGTYTLTAASGKNAIEILSKGFADRGEHGALTIQADATNPGGIDAGSKACVYYKYDTNQLTDAKKAYDRPIIYIKGGVFEGSSSSGLSCSGHSSAQDKCATFNISGGIFNCGVNLTRAKLIISGGTFNSSVGCTGGSTSNRVISGGRFKSFGWMTADAASKFAVGTAINNYNVGLYVDDEGYLVVGGPVITEPGDRFEASASYSSWKSYLQYSSAATYGLFYTSVDVAMEKSKDVVPYVVPHVDELDFTETTFTGTLKIAEDQELKITYPAGTTPSWKVAVGVADKITVYKDVAIARSGLTMTRIYSVVPVPTVVAPTPKTGLEYTGEAHVLVEDPGSVTPAQNDTSGNQYSLAYGISRERNTKPTEWFDTVPTASEAGTTYLWYKVANSDDAPQAYVEVIIGKATPECSVAIASWLTGQYDAERNAPVTQAPDGVTLNKVTYKGDNYAESETVPTEPGEYTVVAYFNESDSYIAATAEATFTITTPVPAITMYWPKTEVSEGGTVLTTPLAVSEGGTINLITKPEAGKKVGQVTVTDAEGNLLEITDQGNGRHSFVQPDCKVSVKVTFADDLKLADFSDLEADAWYSEAVEYVLDKGYMTGTEAGTFDPAGTMDRTQLITMLWKLEGAPAVADAVYSDVAADADYANALAWAAKAGIALGHTDGRFAPAETMTLEQLTAFLYRYVQYKAGAEEIITDLASAMNWAEESGLLAGLEGQGTPDTAAQRIQVAYSLWDVLGK